MKFFLKACSLLIAAAVPVCVDAKIGDIVQGKNKSAACAGCHGSDGISLGDEFPNLAGQKSGYLIKQLKAFKNGVRIDPTMNAMTRALTEKDIVDLASYFSQLKATGTNGYRTGRIKTMKASALEFPKSVFISMKGSGSIEALPSERVSLGGPNMLYTAITPNGEMLLSTSPSTNSLYVFDALSLRRLAIIQVGKAPKGVKVTPDGRFGYVSNQGSADISIIDLASLKNVDSIKVAQGPHNIRFTKNGDFAYVTLQGGAGVGVINTKTRTMTKVIAVPGITGPHNLDLSSDEKIAYVRDFVHHVAVLDLTTEKVIKVLKVGNGHGGIDVDPEGRFVATAAIGDNVVSIIDPKTLSVRNIEVGKGPHGIRASKNGQWIYVTLTGEDKVAVINTSNMRVEKNIDVEKFPFWVAVQGNP